MEKRPFFFLNKKKRKIDQLGSGKCVTDFLKEKCVQIHLESLHISVL